MRSAIAMLTAALVLSGAASHAQEPAGTASNPATAAESGTATVKPTVRPAEPNPRTKLLFDVINVLTQPRPAAPPGATAPAPAEPVATALPPAIVPIEPKPAAVAVTPAAQVPPRAVVSRDAGTATALPVPRPGPSATPPLPPPATDEPLSAEAAPPAPPPATAAVPPAATEPFDPESILEPANAVPGTIGWLLLGLIAAAAITGASAVQRARRIARTRAALSLEPQLDLSAGAGSANGLALAGPSVGLRTRLDWVDTP